MSVVPQQQHQALLQAARGGDKSTAMDLLVVGVNPNCKDLLGFTPLMWAAYYNRVEVTEVILYYSANLNVKSQGGHTAIHIAVSKGSFGCASLLCKAGANLSSRSNNGYTPLHEGSNSGKLDCVRVLIEYKVQINIKSNEGFTPLHLAASKGNLEICQLLLDCGAAIEFSDSAGRTALHLAASCPHGKPVVDLLLARGANAAKKCMKNMTPMQYAVEFNCTVSISILQLAEAHAKTLNSVSAPDRNLVEEPIYNKPIFGPPQPNRNGTTGPNLPKPNFDAEDVENIRKSEVWREMEQDLARKNKTIEQMRSEKTQSEAHYTQSLKQLVQEIKELEEKLSATQKELETARGAQKELDATRKKLDALLVELRTTTARHARLCEHVADMEENRLCKVCFERPIGTVLAPCSHCCLCVECAAAVQKKDNKCPICRQTIGKSTLCYFT